MSAKPNTAHDTIVALAELFPACFSVFEGRRKPLKIGIREDLLAALGGAITPEEAHLALAVYTGNHCYLKACAKAGTPRIDLNGEVVGSVSTEEAANAKERFEQQRDRRKRQQEAIAKAKAEAERKARNAGRISLGDLRRAAQARRVATIAAE
jgi:ProP effector